MTYVTLLAAALLACGDKDGGTDDTGGGSAGDGGSTSGLTLEDFINVTTAPTGDLASCCELAGLAEDPYCWSSGTWIEQTVITDYQVDKAVYGTVNDFESGDPVPSATVEFWWGNDPTAGNADYEIMTDGDGNLDSQFKTCTPVAYKVSTDPDLEATVDTYELNQVEPYSEGSLGIELNSVSTTTYAIIPNLLGVSPDGDKGIIAGTAFDCGGEPVEGAQVVVRDAVSGEIPESLVVKYFVSEFPNRDQPHTSDDGLWVAINIPEGLWSIEMYVYDPASSSHVMVASAQAPVFPESILISNLYTGFDDGIRYPDICVE